MRMMNSWLYIANEEQMRCGRMVLLYKQQWEVDKWGCLGLVAVLHALLLNHHVAREPQTYKRGITALASERLRYRCVWSQSTRWGWRCQAFTVNAPDKSAPLMELPKAPLQKLALAFACILMKTKFCCSCVERH